MAKYSDTVYQKSFTGKTMKDAYLKACKWYASNVLSKDELHNIQVEYIKDNKKQLPTITARLFTSVEEAEIKATHCAICKETHASFFINENCNCAWCNTDAFERRIREQLNIKRTFIKNKIERSLYND